MKQPKISDAVIKRLPIYLRYLEFIHHAGVQTLSSQELGEKLDINPAQIRKDLAYFGEFGRKGIGYDVEYAINSIRHILKLDRTLPIVLIGAGHLGHALCNYNAYLKDNMRIIAVFDDNPSKIGKSISGLAVKPMNELQQVIEENSVKIGIIAVPAKYAQIVADRLIQANIKAILNFAPVNLKTPSDVRIHQTDVTTELQSLAFFVE